MMFWVLWAALGCSSSPEEVVCEVLDEAQCSTTPKCMPIHARPSACIDGEVEIGEPKVYAGCYSFVGQDTSFCEELSSTCWRPEKPSELYHLGDMCIPDGWDCNIGEDACGW